MDNIELNSGSGGATLATDDAGAGGHVQIVKLAVSTDGSATTLTADNTNGLLVDVKRIQGNVTVVGAAADGAALSGNPVLIAGSDGTNAQSISTTAGGHVHIHDGGNTITVDGTVAVSSVGGTVTVDGSGATQPVSHAGLTALNGAISGTEVQVDVLTLPAVTNGGTFAVQVDGAALTALQLIDDPVATLGTTTYAETTTKGMIVGAVRRDADTTLVDTTNEIGPLQMDANGRLKVEAFSGETLPVSLASVPSHAVTNAGVFVVQVDGSALTSLQLIDDAVFTDDAGFTPGASKGLAVGFQADESSTDSVDEGDFGVPRITLDRKVIVTPQPHTIGGLSIFRSLDLDESEEEVSSAACSVYGWFIANLATSTRFVKFYNATNANTTVGSTTPVLTLPIPGNSTDDIAANALGAHGITFSTALTVAATTGLADADTGAPGTNDVVINLFYK